MAEEKKPGLLKRIFSFGFGRRKEEEPAPDAAPEIVPEVVEDRSAEIAAEQAAREQAAKEEAERRAAEEKAVAEAARQQAEAERIAEEKAAKEKAATEKAAKEKAEAERIAAEEKARAEADKAAKAETAARQKAEKQAADKAAKAKAAAEKKEAEAAAKARAAEAAARAEADRKASEARAAKEAEAARFEQEQLERQRLEQEKLEQERLKAEREAAEREAARQAEIEKAAIEKAAAEKAAAEEAARQTAALAEQKAAAGRQEAATELPAGDSKVTLTQRKATKQPEPEPQAEAETEARREGWLKRLSRGLSRSSTQLRENISQVFTGRKLDDDTLQDLEDILVQADLGVETAMRITDALSDQKFGKEVTDEEVRQVMADEIETILDPVALDLDLDLNHQPHVILVVGVNGSGKTTTIGKLAAKLYEAGFSTTLVAGDTFRAAAIEQLKIWGERTLSPVLFRPLGSDAAGLAYDAWEETRREKRDVMLMDTAGRLQNKKELMAELEKIVRVLRKQDPTAPHTVLLTLDATTGQNAMNQVEIFKDVAGVNGLVMTKLDGTARGGILVAISAKHRLPVYFIGVGEQVEDLEPFEAREFARSIAGLPRES